jgi:hypothetical protein
MWNWDKLSIEDRKMLAARAGHNNPLVIARLQWGQITDWQKNEIRRVLADRWSRGQRVPGYKETKGIGPSTRLVADTVELMLDGKYGYRDLPAIRMLSNNLLDIYRRRKLYYPHDLDRISQEAIVRKVKNELQRRGWYP